MTAEFDLSLYFIIDPECCAGRDMAGIVDAAIQGGVTMVQYRDKHNAPDIVKNHAACLKESIAGRVPFIINDYVDIAVQIDADGVHIGQGDMDPVQARDLIGSDKILGLTAFTPYHIRAVDPDIIDYIGTGPVYPTQTDKGKPVLGAERFGKLVELSPVPVVGIGGITAGTASAVIRAGANGVAVMRCIGQSDDPLAAARQFKR